MILLRPVKKIHFKIYLQKDKQNIQNSLFLTFKIYLSKMIKYIKLNLI